MSAPAVAPVFAPPPLPPGWTEHIAPTGHVYYFNASTNESTYTRPLPSFANLPRPAPAATKKKKEKPLTKTPIPGTEWIRVRTTENNIFYSHKPTKKSLWTVPDEIAEAVRALELDEEAEESRKAEEARKAEEEAEVERVKREAQEASNKRKAGEKPVEGVKSKKARVEEVKDEDEGDDDDESEEEEWQREAAAQLAAEAEEAEKKRKEEEELAKAEEQRQKDEMEAKAKQLNLPDRVDLSLDEAKALFKTLLREKNINPLHPWDMSLPLFVNDPRYILLPSVTARREAFDEYCRDRARELREQSVKEQKETANPKDAFERLIKEEVKSTRTSWTEWRRTWKKDRRFYGWGRDDREREKRFREYLKELGEKKRAEAQKAEANFFALLKESGLAQSGAVWKDVKRKISSDPRYEAVGSSSLREELFNTYLKARDAPGDVVVSEPALTETASKQSDAEMDTEQRKKERKERAVREREAQVKANLLAVGADIGRSKMGLDREEGESRFRTLLTDAIRDPQISWDDALKELEKDPRYTHSPLPKNQMVHLFHSHIGQLRSKHLDNIHALFESHASSLATPFSDLPLPSLLSSLPATRLGLDERALENEFDRWQRERTTSARAAFDAMLGENTFVEFWGRLRKIGGEGVDGGVKADDIGDEDEGEGAGGRADMKKLAKSIDLREMEKVLKNDKRFVMFDHMPEARGRWLRDYLENLAAPQLSVHIPKP